MTVKRVLVYIATFRWLPLGIIRLYKIILSPVMGKGCLYYPTCSTYAYEAILKYGTLRGSIMGGYRILRCNPLSKGGFDPVPDNPKGDMRWLV